MPEFRVFRIFEHPCGHTRSKSNYVAEHNITPYGERKRFFVYWWGSSAFFFFVFDFSRRVTASALWPVKIRESTRRSLRFALERNALPTRPTDGTPGTV